jgi:YD repeat-containing protein
MSSQRIWRSSFRKTACKSELRTAFGLFSYDRTLHVRRKRCNTLSDPSGKSYSWDFENRLTQAVVPGTGTVAFKYDPFGRRIQKSGPLGTTNYLYDGDWANVIEEVDGTGSVVARYTQEELGLDLGAGPSFRWFNPDAGALPLSRFVRQGGGFDFPFPEATRKNWHAPVHSRAHETTMRICPGV